MARFSHRESVLLGYSPHRSFATHYSSYSNSSSKSKGRDSDIDFNDVFGGPPRRSSTQEARNSYGEAADSFALTSEDESISFCDRWSGLNEKPVFGDESVNRRRYTNNDFFDDIFGGCESLSSSPRKHDPDLFSSSSGSRVLSPVWPLPPKAEPFGSPSLPAQFSLPARLIKGTDLPSTRNHHKNKDGVTNGTNYYSPLSRVSSSANQVQNEQGKNVHQENSSLQELFLESSNETKHDEIDNGSNMKRGSNNFEIPTTGSKLHFSTYKWASKEGPLAMPLRGVLKDNSRLERCSSSSGRLQREGITCEFPATTSRDNDFPSFNANTSSADMLSRMELGQVDSSLVDTSASDTNLGNSELNTPRTCQAIVEDIPGNNVFQKSTEKIKPSCIPEMVAQEAARTERKPLYSLFLDNDQDQDANETISKNRLGQCKVKSTKKSSAVFDVSKNEKEQDRNGTALKSKEADKSEKFGDNIGKSRVKGNVKEFVKIFNQEAPDKLASDANSQNLSTGRKGGSKFRAVDEASVTTTQINAKTNLSNVNKKNMPEAPVKASEYLRKPEKQNPETGTNDYRSGRISSGLKDSSPSTAASVPDGSEPTVGDADESFRGNFLVKELFVDDYPLPQSGNNDEIVQVMDGKIQRWSNGKEGNIRSLLSTLQYVLWPDSGWKPVPLADIIEGNAVKRSYQKALLCLHPDKLQQKGASSQQKYTAEKVFNVLQEAWTHFSSLSAM